MYMVVSFRREARKLVVREFERSIRDSDSLALGEHSVQLADDALTVRSGEISAVYPVSALRSINTTPEHTFVFLDELTGFPIPRATVLAGDYTTFIDALHHSAKRATSTRRVRTNRTYSVVGSTSTS